MKSILSIYPKRPSKHHDLLTPRKRVSQRAITAKPVPIPKHRLLEGTPRKPLRSLFWLACSLIGACLLIMLNQKAHAGNAINGLPEQLPNAGQLLLLSDQNYHPAVHLKSHMHVEVAGPVATVTLRQGFHNNSNQWAEGIYIFPLAEQSSVYFLSMTLKDRQIIGEIKEKTEAKAIYQAAKAAGKKAVLMEQQRDNIFQQKIANIAPNETLWVEIKLQMPITYQHPHFELRLPTTLTPRYSPYRAQNGSITNSSKNGIEPTELQQFLGPTSEPSANYLPLSDIAFTDPTLSNTDHTLRNPVSIEVLLHSQELLANIQSQSHTITTHLQAQGTRINTQQPWVEMDRDFVLRWQLPSELPPTSQFYYQASGGEHYGLLWLAPPTQEVSTINQDIIFIIDTSGSMGGTSLEQAKLALLRGISRLEPEDSFNIIEFNSSFRPLFSQTKPADTKSLQQAQRFIKALEAGGGTNMKPALEYALQPNRTTDIEPESPNPMKQIVFITDGSVDNETELFSLINQKLQNARLFTVGIGSAPNSYFMRKAAQVGRGTFIFINHVDQVREQIEKLFTRLESPVLQDIQIDWPEPVEVWPARLSDLYLNDPMAIAIKFNSPQLPSGAINLSGFYADGSLWQEQVTIDPSILPKLSAPGIAKLWARQKIDYLLDGQFRGEDEQQIKPAVIDVALQHQLLSPYTAFIAVDQRITRPQNSDLKTAEVPLTPPNRQLQLPAPQTATNAGLSYALAVLFALMSMSLWNRRANPLNTKSKTKSAHNEV